MADGSKIEWTDATWNIVTGCSVISPGCTNCYAMRLAGTRLKNHVSRAGLTTPSKAGPVWNGETRVNWEWIGQPLGWTRPRTIFPCAHGDLFHESVSWENIATIYGVMIAAHHLHGHIFQVLTKRTKRARTLLNDPHFWSLANSDAESNVMDRVDPLNRRSDDARATLDDYGPGSPPPGIWLGTSVEDQQRADERIPHLLATPAAMRWLSCEPLLGPVDLTNITGAEKSREYGSPVHGWSSIWRNNGIGRAWIEWVVVGGESGPVARPAHPDWFRALRDQCADAGVPFFFKQWGEWVSVSEQSGPGAHHQFEDGATMRRVGKKLAGRLLDGVEHNAMPEVSHG